MHADERATMARRKLDTFAMGYANPASWRDCPHACSRTFSPKTADFFVRPEAKFGTTDYRRLSDAQKNPSQNRSTGCRRFTRPQRKARRSGLSSACVGVSAADVALLPLQIVQDLAARAW